MAEAWENPGKSEQELREENRKIETQNSDSQHEEESEAQHQSSEEGLNRSSNAQVIQSSVGGEILTRAQKESNTFEGVQDFQLGSTIPFEDAHKEKWFQDTVKKKEELTWNICRLYDKMFDESQKTVTTEMRQLMRLIKKQSQEIEQMDKDVLEKVEILWKAIFD